MKKLTNILLTISLAVLIFGSGYKFGEYKSSKTSLENSSYNPANRSKTADNPKDIDFTLFWDTWEKVDERFIDQKKTDAQTMFYGAIKGMVASLDDPYTFFLTPEENKQSKDDLGGKFEGIGAQLGLKNNRVVVIAPIKNSPAEQAGVRAGDIIVKVNDQMTRSWNLPYAVSKIRGQKGTKVKLTLERNSKQFDVNITRDEIVVDSIELTYDSKKVAHLKVNQFGNNTNTEWDKVMPQIKQKWSRGEIRGLVLDLRDNPGGYLDSAVYLASEFLPQGKLVVKQEATGGQSKEYRSFKNGTLEGIPLVILINKGSASASEILAGALRDHKKATLVGEKSFGKGSVQEALDLRDGAGLHVTVAKWILPNGEWINGKGITPQIKVENKAEEGNTLTREKDKQLERAIQELIK